MGLNRTPTLTATKVACVYALASGAWILFSDMLVAAATTNVEALTRAQTVKGWAFVLATSLLLFFMTRHEMRLFFNADAAQRASDSNFRVLVENAPEPIFIQAGSRFAYLNAAATALFGAGNAAELVGRPVMDRYHPDFHDIIRERIRRVNSERRPAATIEQVFVRMDGGHVTVEVNSVPFEYLGENGALVFVRDITERRRSEDALRESESRFRALADSMPQLVWTATPDGRMDYFNRRIEEFRGFVQQADGSWEWSAVLHPEDLPATVEAWRHAIRTGRANEAEHRMRQRDGSYKWFLSRTTPARDPEGRVVKWYGASTEIDSRKKAEQKLLEATRRLDFLVTESPAVMFTYELRPEPRPKFISRNVEKILGWKPERFTENFESWRECLHPDDLPMVMEALARLETTGREVLEYRFMDCHGRYHWIHDEGRTIAGEDGRLEVVGAWWDVTEAKAAQDELRRLAAAIEQAAEMVVVTDAQSVILYANPAFEKITGYRQAEVLGKNPRLLKSGEHDRGFYQQLWAQISAGKPWQGRFVNRKKDGSLYTEEATISPVLGPSGDVVNYVAVKRDVTREQELEQQYLEAQKMEAIGTLAGGIAHDFNNILAIILANAQILEFSETLGGEAKETLGQIITASKRARQLVRQILAFSRRGRQEKIIMNLKPIVKETLGLLRASLPTTIRLEPDIAAHTGMLFADPTQLQQVLMNLCTNAAHAMEDEGGTLRISLGGVTVGEQDALLEPGFAPGDYVRLSVADTGRGMQPWVLKRIFEPYFTTKETGKGTGLGLSVAHGIVKSHGGTIKVSSASRQGTVFDVYLPVVPAEEAETDKPDLPLVRGTGRVLLVDDEPALTLLGQKILNQLGYEVQTTNSPAEALEVFRSKPEVFDLVITDLTMPELTGTQLAKKLLEIRPELPIILCTGFGDQVNEGMLKAAGIKGLLLKPLTLQEFAHAVRMTISPPGGF